MAGFKEGALQLKKKDSLAPSDIGSMRVLINSAGQMYTVDEYGVSALIQGGSADHKLITTSADIIPGVLSNKLIPGMGTTFDIVDDATYGKQVRINLSGVGGSVDWPTITNVPIASASTSGVLTSASWNTFNNKQSAITSASNILLANLSATNLYEGGALLSNKYATLNHTQGWATISGVPVASSNTSGVLTSADWNTFSNKQSAIGPTSNLIVNSVSAISISGTHIGNTSGLATSAIYASIIPNTTVAAGSYGSSTQIPTFTVGVDGRLTLAGQTAISVSGASGGTVTSVSTSSNTLSIVGSPVTISGTIGVNLTSGIATPGTYIKQVVDTYGRTTSGGPLTSADIPALPYISSIPTTTWASISGVPTASTSTSGVLTSADWNTFSNKQSAIGPTSNLIVNSVSAISISGSNIIENGVNISSKYALVNHTQSWNTISAIPVASMTTSGVITSSDYVNFSNTNITAGVVDFTPPVTTYNIDGTISITSANINIYNNSTYQGLIKTYNVPGVTLSLIDGAQQYIVADYNSGSPIYRIESNKSNINSSNVVGVYITWRQGNNVHSVDYDSQGLQLPNKIASSILETSPYKVSVDGGLILSETSTPIERTVAVTSAIVYVGITPHSVSAYNSSVDILTFVNHVGGVWTYTSGTTQYNNSQYDNGVDLVSMSNVSKYSVRWFYRSIGKSKEVFYVLGTNEYNSITNAQLETPRTDIPTLLKGHCVLVGRIIIKNGSSFGIVENAQTTTFGASQVTNHNDLQNIQGGVVGEYYHLVSSQYNFLTSGGDTSLHFHSSDRNRANHTGTQLASTISDFTSATRVLFSSTSPIIYTSSTGVISSTIASTNSNGYLTSADWNTFSNKQSALTTASNIIVNSLSAVTLSGTSIVENGVNISTKYAPISHTQSWTTISAVPTASTSTSGVLTSVDWNTFINKQNALTTASNIVVGSLSAINISATNIVEGGTLLSSKYAPISHTQSWTTISAVPVASTSTSGVLTSTDWTNFNNKQAPLTTASNIVVGSVSATNISAINLFDTNMTGGFALISNANKSIGESIVTTFELTTLSAVSADVQAQLNSKLTGTFTNGDDYCVPVFLSAGGFQNSSSYIVGANKEKFVMTDKTQAVTSDYHSPGIGFLAGVNLGTPIAPMGWFLNSDTTNSVKLFQGFWGNGNGYVGGVDWTRNTLKITSAGIVSLPYGYSSTSGLLAIVDTNGTVGKYILTSADLPLSYFNNNYMPISGGNFTGLVSGPNANFTNLSATGGITLHDNFNPDVYFGYTSVGSPLYINIGGATYMSFDSNNIYLNKNTQFNNGTTTFYSSATFNSPTIFNNTINSKAINTGSFDVSAYNVFATYGVYAPNISATSFTGRLYTNGGNNSQVVLGDGSLINLSSITSNIGIASATTSGSLTSGNWNTFNNKQNALTTSSSISIASVSATSISGATIFEGGTSLVTKYAPLNHTQAWTTITAVPTASASTSGVLSSSDWNTFNNKQSAITSASNIEVGSLSATNLYEGGVLLSSKYVLATTTRWTSAISITTGSQTISANHGLNYQYSRVRCFNTTTNETILLDPQYSISTTNIMVFNFNSSSSYSMTMIIEK